MVWTGISHLLIWQNLFDFKSQWNIVMNYTYKGWMKISQHKYKLQKAVKLPVVFFFFLQCLFTGHFFPLIVLYLDTTGIQSLTRNAEEVLHNKYNIICSIPSQYLGNCRCMNQQTPIQGILSFLLHNKLQTH